MELENLEKIINCHEKLNQGDTDAALEYFAENTSNHGIPVGREGIKMVLEDIYKTFPDWRFEIAEILAKDDSVIIRTLISGTHLGKGEFPVNGGMLVGVEPTGKSFKAQHIHWFKLRGGKIVEHYASRDDIGMMQQLGLFPETALHFSMQI